MSHTLSKTIKLNNLLQKSILISEIKNNGIYFTNNIVIIDTILDCIDFRILNILNKKILDPCVGNGIFIIRAIEIFIKVNNANYEITSKFVENCLFFNDIDSGAIENTKKAIIDLFSENFKIQYSGNYNYFNEDFTGSYDQTKNIFNNSNHFKLTNKLKFDYIIGNPPYVTFYGRRDKKKSELQRVQYLLDYNQFPRSLKNGKINMVMLFLEKSINLLVSGGVSSFIIDISFFETAYKYTRKYILENSTIISLIHNISAFENVASGQLILTLQNNKTAKSNTKIIDYALQDENYLDQNTWNNDLDEYKFRMNFCNQSNEIIKKIKTKAKNSFENIFPNKSIRTSCMLLDMEDKFVSSINKTKTTSNEILYYQGAKSLNKKYVQLDSSLSFEYNTNLQNEINLRLKKELETRGIKNKKRIGLGDLKVYLKPKIYVRQSAKKIIATLDFKNSASNNSLYIISLPDTYNTDYLYFLTAYLNSDLVTFYCQEECIIRYSKGKQPQIKISDLKTLKIPEDNELIKILTSYCKNIYKYNNQLQTLNIISSINEIIFKYFNITSEEKEFIVQKIINYLKV